MLRQSVERALDSPPLLGARRTRVGRLTRVDQLAVPLLLVDALGPKGPPARGPRSGAVGRDVHGDSEQPRVEGRLPPERREPFPRADERLLGDVPRLLCVPQDVEREAVDPLTVFLDERLERRDVARAATLDPGEIAEVRHGSHVRPAPAAGSTAALTRRVPRGPREGARRAPRP